MALVKIVLVLTFVALARAEQNLVAHIEHRNSTNSSMRNDDYIDAQRRQHAFNIWYYDVQINFFKDSYLDRVNAMEYQKDSLLDKVKTANEQLYPLTLLSDFSKVCVKKYQAIMPSREWVKYQMDICISEASMEVDWLASYMASTNNTLQTYYRTTFEKEVTACQTKYNSSMSANQTLCLADVVSTTNTFTYNNQKTFSTQLEAAKNSADMDIKTLHECSFAIQNTTLSKIAEANTRIDRCIHGADDCPSCHGHFCNDVSYMSSSSIDTKNATMYNPFYGRQEIGDCLMLSIF
uniref:Protein TsetseEP domain-containing protein n=1 Tax=Stomoxys calcitrans TaxID=35570 RepID=A0A1I8PBC6_STOCA